MKTAEEIITRAHLVRRGAMWTPASQAPPEVIERVRDMQDDSPAAIYAAGYADALKALIMWAKEAKQ